jgi:hypothetical protein
LVSSLQFFAFPHPFPLAVRSIFQKCTFDFCHASPGLEPFSFIMATSRFKLNLPGKASLALPLPSLVSKTTVRFDDLLGLTELRKNIPLIVMAYYSKRAQLNINNPRKKMHKLESRSDQA